MPGFLTYLPNSFFLIHNVSFCLLLIHILQVLVTDLILLFMVVMLLSHKLPYGLTAMICCTLFVLTGVTDIKTAFSGFSSSTTIMVATMIVVAT